MRDTITDTGVPRTHRCARLKPDEGARKTCLVVFVGVLLPFALTGCDVQVIYPWDRGGGNPPPKVSQPAPRQPAPHQPPPSPPPRRIAKSTPSVKVTPCEPPQGKPQEIVVNQEKWKKGLTLSFQEPSTTRDDKKLHGLTAIWITYHLNGNGTLGPPQLAKKIAASSGTGGQKREGTLRFGDLPDLGKHLRQQERVSTVFCARAISPVGTGNPSPSIGITFRRAKNWMPPP